VDNTIIFLNEQHRPHKKTQGKLGCSRRVSSSCLI